MVKLQEKNMADKKKPAGKNTKRKREENGEAVPKKRKLDSLEIPKEAGSVLTVGEGDVGQLGLGESVLNKLGCAKVDIPEECVTVAAGGMHTVVLTKTGKVYTFGCNDEGALGRDTSKDGSEMSPGLVKFSTPIVQISAGDSHTAALDEDGQAYICGTFRDANGIMGLGTAGTFHKSPIPIFNKLRIVKISSGNDHLVGLTETGKIYTVGNAEQGQLGRVAECFARRGGRKGSDLLINPDVVRFRRTKGVQAIFSDVWTGSFTTFAKVKGSGEIFGWGLNNYYQLGLPDMENRFVPVLLSNFSGKDWKCIASGQHHSIALESKGNVYAFGRAEYGRLGLGEDSGEKKEPTLIDDLSDHKCISIAAGSSVSFAVTESKQAYGWGMGTNQQLSNGDDEDKWEPTLMRGKVLKEMEVLQVAAGGQHTVVLAKDKDS